MQDGDEEFQISQTGFSDFSLFFEVCFIKGKLVECFEKARQGAVKFLIMVAYSVKKVVLKNFTIFIGKHLY